MTQWDSEETTDFIGKILKRYENCSMVHGQVTNGLKLLGSRAPLAADFWEIGWINGYRRYPLVI